jgi:bacterial/archaeal transporter family protein
MSSRSWILLSLLSGFIMALVNLIDRYVLTRLVKQAVVPLFVLGLVGLVPGLVILLVKGGPGLSWPHLLLGAAAGIAFLVMGYFYFRAAQIEEISRVVPLFYLAPVLVAVPAFFFLGEHFPSKTYLGILALIAGAVLLSSRRPLGLGFSRAFRLMALASLSLAIYTLLTKYLLTYADYWTVFAVSRVGMALGLVPFAFRHRPELKAALAGRRGAKVACFMTANEVLALAGSLFFTMAAAVGPISLVNALSSTQPFFVFVLSLVLALIWPRLLQEDIGWGVTVFKFLAIALMFWGLVLIV